LENLNTPAQQDDFLIFETEKNLEIILSYFEVVKWQNWVSYFEVLELKENYDKIKSDLLESVENSELEQRDVQHPKRISHIQEHVQEHLKSKSLDARKEKILDILKEKEKIQVWELNKLLPNVSKRTLRRDFEQLLRQGLVQRIGERNNTFYKLS
jgi:Fic family protein